MAGESPDRSKQRESSAEPTSGSASPVPEARSEARDSRDPRLALAGDSGTSGTSGTSGSSDTSERGGVDTATRVLSVRDLKTAEDEPAEDSGAVEGSGGPEDPKGSEEDAEDAPGAETGSEPESGADADDESADVREGDGEGDDASEAAAPADAKPAAKTTAKADAEPDAEGDSEPAAKAEAKKDGGKKSDAGESDAKTAGAKKAGAKPEAEGESGAEAKSASEPDSGSASEPDSGSASEPPVDQPTAVFKAPKPPVDQPTTMLKLGGDRKDGEGVKGGEKAGKGGGKGGPVGGAGSAPEAEAERTSTFVALKPLDDPATRKPRQKPDTGAATPQKPKEAPGTQPQPPRSPQRPKTAPEGTAATAAVPAVGPERTTQQPLPPKPPLDLLAELTNTPPPPETPLRTTVRRVKIWTPLVVLLLIVFAVVQAVRPLPAPGLTLTAKDSHTFAGGTLSLPWPDEGQGWMDVNGVGTMDHFGEQKPVAIGSVAKTMTAYIILRDHPLKPGEEGPKIKIDATAEKEGGYDVTSDESTLNTVKAGDFLTEKQALSAVMIPSANNIARLLARWDAGSEAAFVKKMNATAQGLGMTDTTYTDPSGLTKTTVSTAHDQVRLGDAAVRDPAMVAITSVASWTDPYGHNWPNYNELPYRMGAIGFKTGTTTAAGGNLLFAARKEVGGQTVTVVGAILAQHKPTILKTVNRVSETALRAAKDALASEKILKKGDVVGYVDDRLGGHTPIVVTKDVTAVGWAGSKVKLSFTAGEVPHSAKAGTRVGTLTVGDGGAGGAVQVPVALQKDLAEPGFTDKLTRLG
ncbi:D-alanyl-D-alanine carboxypeptidase [Streptomyces sp. NPDC018610]|uniref:D-alanyl-D-alanine carboxypeptidase n=1 Tax=Streptomyces sp. NPDC018610 TaxID=3365049 RepID=UPI0037BAA360